MDCLVIGSEIASRLLDIISQAGLKGSIFPESLKSFCRETYKG